MYESTFTILADFTDFANERQMFLSPIHKLCSSTLFVATYQDSNHELST